MNALIIKADKKSNKILSDLAKKLGGNVMSINDDQLEDLVFGKMIEEAKSGETVSKEEVIKRLQSK
ncbi:MAG: hypothetical protein RH860_01030 [Cytophagales bacterium]